MNIEQEIQLIKDRNKKVEADKSWETSTARKVLIALVTYVFMVIFMKTINVNDVFISALVPTFGFLLSTISMNLFKNLWLKSRNK